MKRNRKGTANDSVVDQAAEVTSGIRYGPSAKHEKMYRV